MRVPAAVSVTLALALALGTYARRAHGQAPADTARLPAAVRIPAEREIALALSAAPKAVADSAEVWVLGDRGYEKVRNGTNGFGCIVQRALSGQSLIPRCDDASGVAALFPVYQLIETMRRDGRTMGEARTAIRNGFRDGTLKAPRFGGISYMYSVDGYFAAGERKLPFTPHVMIYWPDCNVKQLGANRLADLQGTALGFIDYGTPECTLIVNTPPATARRVDGTSSP